MDKSAGVHFAFGVACLISLVRFAGAADPLPVESPYKGEIRRDASGALIVVPFAPRSVAETEPPSKTNSVLRVGPKQEIKTIAAAAARAQDGDTIEIEAGDYVGDVAVWKRDRLIIRGVGGRVRLIANGAAVEGKGIWIIRGGHVTVENIEFTGARVRDLNGAGIRFERGHLVIRKCRFMDNENGILTGNDKDSVLEIENSEFGHNGAGDGQSHNLYTGAIRKLRVIGSYFHHAKVGHLLKSRAAENHILYNRLTDETDGRASYEMEFPAGGVTYVIGNIIEQSKTTENYTVISYGAEGYKHPANELYLINNTLIDRRVESGYFLTVRPGFNLIKAYNNLLLGKRPLNAGGINGEFINNPNVTEDAFVMADRNDFRVKRESSLHRTYRSPGSANGVSLAPEMEYVHPAGTRVLATMPTLPGARQTLQPDRQD
jgi:hypothetical protein